MNEPCGSDAKTCSSLSKSSPDGAIGGAGAPLSEVAEKKGAIRKQAHDNRRTQEDKDGVSDAILLGF